VLSEHWLGDGVDCVCVRFPGQLRVTSLMNEAKQKHIRVELAGSVEHEQQHSNDELHAQCVRTHYTLVHRNHW